ncbi:dihydrofolate reductase family protein [Kribbella catacumbae]|uniref:dihydrofolate reductase family protein n=1 Tax=Kribbella catacumbae TaxID=460086 RepID=UPI000367FC3A|nr:dihydrofolate reductase family protein [Kribbella catacumbae]
MNPADPQQHDDPTPLGTGKVLLHFVMSLDGFIADAGEDPIGWFAGVDFRPGIVEEYAASIGAILGGRKGWDALPDPSAPYGGAMGGPVFILTHHPEDAQPAEGATFLNCDVAEAARIALEGAGGKNLAIFSGSIGSQLLERGLIDEIHLHIVPVLLGNGVRFFDNAGGTPIKLEPLNGDAPRTAIDVRYRPVASR